MLEGPLRAVAIVATLLLLAGWGLFAIDQAGSARDRTQAEVAGVAAASEVDPSPEQELAREAVNGDVREAIDDANDGLLAPFAPVVESAEDEWVRRTVPAVLGLLLYGLGLGYLARFSRGIA